MNYAAFRAEYVRLSSMSAFQRCNENAEREKRRRAAQEAEHPWRAEFVEEWHTIFTNRPEEDELFYRLWVALQLRTKRAVTNSEVVREVLGELRRDAHHRARLRDVLKARGVTLAHIEVERGKLVTVEVALDMGLS